MTNKPDLSTGKPSECGVGNSYRIWGNNGLESALVVREIIIKRFPFENPCLSVYHCLLFLHSLNRFILKYTKAKQSKIS